MQAEYATDVLFHRQADFQPLYGGVSPNRRFFRHSKLSCLDALDSLICVHSTLT